MSYIHVRNSALRAALVSNFMLTELLTSRESKDYRLWLVSPWIADFALSMPPDADLSVIVDSVEPQPRLFEVLRQIAANGGCVCVVVRPEWESARIERFIKPLRELAVAEPRITVRYLDALHAKIYAGRHGALYGSLNLTASGAEHNIEFGAYASDVRTVAWLQAEAQSLFDNAEESVP